MIQDLEPLDVVKVASIHGDSGFNYQFPRELFTPIFPLKRSYYADGKPVMTIAVKVQAEAYLWMDHDWGTPAERLKAFTTLHADVAAKARELGFDQVYCVLPPEVAKSFGPRLAELGWEIARPWPMYTLELRQT